MATFTVTTTLDTVDAGDGKLSLREAVAQANATEVADTIVFGNAIDGKTLVLTKGELPIVRDAYIDGDQNEDGVRVTSERRRRRVGSWTSPAHRPTSISPI